MKIFLTLKHWQLFLLFAVFPVIFLLAISNPIFMVNVFPIIAILFMGLCFAWIYSTGANLHKKLSAITPMNITWFKIAFFIPIVHMLFVSVFMYRMFPYIYSGVKPDAPFITTLIFALDLLSVFCIFYCLYFNAKVLKAVEWQRPVGFKDFVGEFFLLCFFSIGVWIVQPRINKLFVDNPEHTR